MCSNKRSRMDLSRCELCDMVDVDTGDVDNHGWAVCGECEILMCEDCNKHICEVCHESGGLNSKADFLAVCDDCMEWCEECDVLVHGCCWADHLAECNAKSRAQRAAAAAAQRLEDKENELEKKRNELKRLQVEVANLERDVATAKVNKVRADKDLTEETANTGVKSEAASSPVDVTKASEVMV